MRRFSVVLLITFALAACEDHTLQRVTGSALSTPRADVVASGITDLGTLGGHAEPYRINNVGQVVGFSILANSPVRGSDYHPFLWQHGLMVDLTTASGGAITWSPRMGINDAGQIAGEGANHHAVIWYEGVLEDLGTLPGDVFSAAYAINNRRQAAGYSQSPANFTHAILWKDGAMEDLGTLGGTSSWAWDLNDAGQVIGSSLTPEGELHAFLWQNGVMTDLGTLGGHIDWQTQGASSEAFGINSAGQVVGHSVTADGIQHAFLWQNGVMEDLGKLHPQLSSTAFGINDAGQVVGALNYFQPVIWQNGANTEPDAVVVDVLLPDFALVGINNSGQIIASSAPAGTGHALLLTVTTVPADHVPPILTVPADITVNATSPLGSVVDYAASATDNLPGVTFVCTPASGNVFPIGPTTVTCTATDAAANTASAAFTITVKGADTQISDLKTTVASFGVTYGMTTSMSAKLNAALAALNVGDIGMACSDLYAFINETSAQSGKKIPTREADTLIADATRIRAVLGC